MSKLDDFKKFVSSKPEFIDYIKSRDTSWQKLYELYDIYGESSEVWDKYLSSEKSINFKGILNSIKNINLDSLEENINSIQKAVGLVEEFTKEDKKDSEDKISKRESIDKIYGEE